MTETRTSSSSAVESARLEAVTPTPPQEEPPNWTAPSVKRSRRWCDQAKDAGIALTGPDGLLKVLTAQVVEAALDEELNVTAA